MEEEEVKEGGGGRSRQDNKLYGQVVYLSDTFVRLIAPRRVFWLLF
jgi:hypothetical protein